MLYIFQMHITTAEINKIMASRKRTYTFNSFGDMFNILEGSNSLFSRRRARNALF
jgi:hypothetical protein